VSRRPLDPRHCNVTIDANALDRDGTDRDRSIDRLLGLHRTRVLNIVVPKGVRVEALHRNTPDYVRNEIASKIFTIETELTQPELEQLRRIEAMLRGNAELGKHAADARHLFEAGKYGGGYFVTNDCRMLKKRGELAAVLPPSLNIVTLGELLAIYDDYESGRRI